MNNYWEAHEERLNETEADLAYVHRDEIQEAMNWAVEHGARHPLQFVRDMRYAIMRERQAASLGDFDVESYHGLPSYVALLSPSQELRLLECYKRATLNDPAIWAAASLEEQKSIESRLLLLGKRRKTKAALRRRYGR